MSETTPPTLNGHPVPGELTESLIHKVVHDFYGRIRADELLGPVFNGNIDPDAWPEHLRKMCDFWSSVLLRTRRYDGRPLPPHLRIDGLEEAHFRRWLQLFKQTVENVSPPEVADLFMDRALRIAQSFRMAIAFNRGRNTMDVIPISAADLAPSAKASS